MSYRYLLLDVAQKVYEDSLVWYGERSYQAVDYALQLICEAPDRWRNRFEDFYELNL